MYTKLFILVLALAFHSTTQAQNSTGIKRTPSTANGTRGLSQPAQLSTSSPAFDFRKTRWGMTRDEVRSVESGRIEKDDETMLVYSDLISGMDAYVVYFFTYDKLTRAQYAFKHKHSNDNNFIGDFQNVRMSLSYKYGIPQIDKQFWNNELYRDDHKRWGFAISIGHLSYITQWTNASTDVTLMLTGKKYAINFLVEYESKALNAQNQSMDEQQQSEF